MKISKEAYTIALAKESLVHPAGIEPATSGLGNHSAPSNLAQFGQFSLGVDPVWHKDAQAVEPETVRPEPRSNGMECCTPDNHRCAALFMGFWSILATGEICDATRAADWGE